MDSTLDIPQKLEPAELRAWRERLGLTQERLAKLWPAAGRVTIARWETGARAIPLSAGRVMRDIESGLKRRGES